MAKKAKTQQSFSREKYEEKILHDLNSFLRRELASPQWQFVSFTKVELAGDYKLAKVYWDTFQAEKKQDIALDLGNIRGKLRKLLSGHLEVRHTPQLEFIYDSQFEDEKHITDLLRSEGISQS